MHRIHWFDTQVRAGNYPNSNHLAEQFEISKRQAQRDLEYMSTSLRAPLLYVSGKRGYCYEDVTYVLPHLYITEEEKKVLQFLAYRYRQYKHDHADSIHRIADLLERFTKDQQVDDRTRLPVFHANPKLMQHVQLLSNAIEQRFVVLITYRESTEEDEFQQLRVHPYTLIAHYYDDSVLAFCEQRNVQRAFRLDRISSVTVTDCVFEKESIEAAGVLVNYSQPRRKPFTAKIRLQNRVEGPSWHGYSIRPGAQADVYEIEFYEADTFVQQLFVAEWEQLLSPKWLIEKLRQHSSSMVRRLTAHQEGGGRNVERPIG